MIIAYQWAIATTIYEYYYRYDIENFAYDMHIQNTLDPPAQNVALVKTQSHKTPFA